MPAQLITKEEIIDLKNSFACGKAALENYKFYNRNKKGINEYYCCVINDFFEYLSDILGVGGSTKPYKWLEEQSKVFMNNKEYINFLNKYNIKYDPESEIQKQFIQDIKDDIDFYAGFISSPTCEGYKQYLNDKVTDKSAIKYLNRYLGIVEKIYEGCPPTNMESKYGKIIFRENNKFYKALFNR